MPFPSGGCRTCKIRRIKCDEAQPICQRCIKSRRICCGMRVGPFVHLENPYASGQEKRPRGPRSVTIADELACDLASAVLKRPLSVDLKTRAIFYYLRDHLYTLKDAPNVSKGISEDVLPNLVSITETPVLDLAISSIALAVFSRTQRCPPAALEASAKYQQLLRTAQVRISSLDRGNIDAFLIAVFFMSRYEGIVHDPGHLCAKTTLPAKGLAFRGFLHHDGALAILKFWKDHLSDNQPASDVIKYTRRAMIKSALLRNLAMPEWMLEGILFGEHGLELEYDHFVTHLANVRRRLSMLIKEKKTPGKPQRASDELISMAEELEKEARDIDTALQNWTAHFPSRWSYQQHTLPWADFPISDFHSPMVYSYSSPAYAAAWNRYYSTRMLVNSTRLRILDLSRSPDNLLEPQRLECLSQIQNMANDLASSLPFSLKRFKVTIPDNRAQLSSSPRGEEATITLNPNEDALKPYLAELTVWPISIASGLVEVKQKSWFRSQLTRVGRMLGDRLLEFESTDQWLQL